jgi:hypothetical protein
MPTAAAADNVGAPSSAHRGDRLGHVSADVLVSPSRVEPTENIANLAAETPKPKTTEKYGPSATLSEGWTSRGEKSYFFTEIPMVMTAPPNLILFAADPHWREVVTTPTAPQSRRGL